MRNVDVAKLYLSKVQSAKARNIDFDLPLMSFCNLLKTKRCKYTGISLTEPEKNSKKGSTPRGTDRTFERIDSTKGYVKGNVIVVCHAANQLKNIVCENPGAVMTVKHLVKMAKKLEKEAIKLMVHNADRLHRDESEIATNFSLRSKK